MTGPPVTLTLRGKASDMRGSGKTTRSGNWEGVPLAQVVSELAARNGWKHGCTVLNHLVQIHVRCGETTVYQRGF